MKKGFVAVAVMILLSLVSAASGQQESIARYERVVKDIVKAINAGDYAGVQKDFGPVMLQAFPLDKTKAFFGALTAQYGRIERLGDGKIAGHGQAVFPAYCERGVLSIKIVLDDQDKVAGLWFLPQAGADAGQKAEAGISSVADPNARLKIFEELDKQLDKLVKGIRRLMIKWTKNPDEAKVDLAKSILRRNTKEFKLVREFAVQENAVKTVEAIDKLLAAKDEQLEKALRKAEKIIEKEKLKAEKKASLGQGGTTDRSTNRDKRRAQKIKERQERRKQRYDD